MVAPEKLTPKEGGEQEPDYNFQGVSAFSSIFGTSTHIPVALPAKASERYQTTQELCPHHGVQGGTSRGWGQASLFWAHSSPSSFNSV